MNPSEIIFNELTITRRRTVILLYLPCRRFRENGVWSLR